MPVREGLDLPAKEHLRYRGRDRRDDDGDGGDEDETGQGGTLAVTDERLILPGPDGPDSEGRVSVPLENVAELTHRSVDWFLVILGLAIVGFGVASVTRNLLGGLAFLVVGLASLVVTWRRRGRVRVHTHTRAKPITVYPAEPDAFLDAVDDALEPVREKRPPDRPSHGVE